MTDKLFSSKKKNENCLNEIIAHRYEKYFYVHIFTQNSLYLAEQRITSENRH